MKRLLVLPLALLFAIGFTVTAWAHTIPEQTVTITCDNVSFQWENFPSDQSIIVYVVVVQGTFQQMASITTNGQSDGSGNVPLTLEGNGPVQVEFMWAVGEEGTHEVVVTKDLDCTPTTTTTPPTTAPPTPTTEPATTPTTVVEGSAPPVSIQPVAAELPNTGNDSLLYAGAGVLMLALGLFLYSGGRRGVKP